MTIKRILGLFLALTLLAAILALPAAGSNNLSFVAVNDAIPLTLSGDSLPFYSDGTLFVPYTVFNASSLGFYPSYNTSDKTLTLFSRNNRLVFDLASGNVTDENKLSQPVTVISRGGMVYLPAVFCASHFGVQVSDLTSQSGYQVVRFTTGGQVYDDALFLEKAENLISYRVSQYIDSNASPNSGTETVVPSEPSPSQPPVQPSDEPEQDPVRVYLAVTDVSTMADALSILEQKRVPAAFFLTADEILANGDLVRQIAASGHMIGLTVAFDTTDVAGDLYAANEALDLTLKSKSLLVLLPETVDASPIAGCYCIFTQPTVRLTASEAAAASGQSRLLICSGENLAASLTILEDAEFRQLLETTVFD